MDGGIILVIEDNPLTREVVSEMLRSGGYDVLEAPDAATGIALVKQALPGLVLQDLALPDMDGFELLRHLRELPGAKDLPIVALSGMPAELERMENQPDQNRCRFNAHLMKPISMSALTRAVEKYLVRGPMRRNRPGVGPAANTPAPKTVADLFNKERMRKVLLVGTAVNREGQRAFEAAGFTVVHVADAEEARATAWRLRPDAIVSDALLTGQDGFQLTLALHADKAMARVPIHLVSDIFDTEDDRDVARRVGACGLIARSGDPQEMIDQVSESIGRAPPAPVGDQGQLREDIADRIRAALRRRLRVGGESSHRLAFLEASVRLLGMLAEALAAPMGDRKSPVELLSHCLAASGTSRGMAYLTAPGGALMMAAEVGISGNREQGARLFFGHPEVLELVAKEQRPLVVPSKEVAHEAAQDILGGLDATSVLIAPLRLGEDSFGAIVLASNRYDLADWTGLASAVSVPISQALALARSRGSGSGD